jgi:hypothetical protein
LIIVFVTLLEPEGESPISGVEAPGEPNRSDLPGPLVYTDSDNQPGGGPGQGNGGGNAGGPGGGPGVGPGGLRGIPGGSGTEGLSLTGPSDGREGGAGGGGGGGGNGGSQGTPSDDQYADSLTRLTLRLN